MKIAHTNFHKKPINRFGEKNSTNFSNLRQLLEQNLGFGVRKSPDFPDFPKNHQLWEAVTFLFLDRFQKKYFFCKALDPIRPFLAFSGESRFFVVHSHCHQNLKFPENRVTIPIDEPEEGMSASETES